MSGFARVWEPWRRIDLLQREIDRMFEGRRQAVVRRQAEFPALNAWQSKSGLLISAEISGLNPDDLEVTVLEDRLTLRGEIQPEPLEEGEAYRRRERRTESFSRSVRLPYEIDPDKTSATYEKGILTIHLKRPEEQLPKKVTIQAL